MSWRVFCFDYTTDPGVVLVLAENVVLAKRPVGLTLIVVFPEEFLPNNWLILLEEVDDGVLCSQINALSVLSTTWQACEDNTFTDRTKELIALFFSSPRSDEGCIIGL